MTSAAFAAASTTLAAQLATIDRELESDRRTSPEDQLKVPISTFLTSIGDQRPAQVNVFTEHRQLTGDNVQGVRLDMAVKDGFGRLVGHIELKAPGKSANPYRQAGWSKHDKAQWKRLKNHANLVYTNGWEWTLLRHGMDRPVAHVLLSPNTDGTLPEGQVEQLSVLLDQFLSWKPTTPSSPRGLAEQLAPLARLLRDSVKEIVTDKTPDALDSLYERWQKDLMPRATPAQFADSFAQTFTYALLLARVESVLPASQFTANAITPALRRNGHRLIGSVLELMGQDQNRSLVDGPVSLLEATIGSVDVDKFTANADPWLYFYEDFLAAYDPKMRAEAGVYYTPVEIVEAQVRLLDTVLKTRFGRPDGLGDDNTKLLDNACGTATYPLAVARHVIDNSAAPQDAARSLAKRLHAFEILMGPYSVAHMRLTQLLESTGIQLGKDGVQVFLTDSLTDPGEVSADHQQISLWEVMEDINEENRRAGLVKDVHTDIRIILGNPPYHRLSRAEALGSASNTYHNVILEEARGNRPLLDDFIEPLKAHGLGGQAKNLYNSYIFFMRWAIWKACEQHKNETGVVSYITASSYLRGPGFAGVREYMRRVFDEVWVIDLGGEGRGARTEENVFSIGTPVAIFLGIQHPNTSTGTPKRHADRIKQKAAVYYQRISGTRKEKLSALQFVDTPENDDKWLQLPNGDWGDKFVPSSAAALSDGVPLDNVFPWYYSGSKAGRTWVIAPTEAALKSRLKALQSVADSAEGKTLFDESPSGRKYDASSSSNLIPASADRSAAINTDADLGAAATQRYGHRSFDRQMAIADHRLVDRPGASWQIVSNNQMFLASLSTTALGNGPAVTISPYVPDLHFFRGSFGAKDIRPLYRTDSTSQPNISASLLQALENSYGQPVDAFDVAAYVVGLLGTSAYTARFEEELSEAPAHVIFTADKTLFAEVAEFGRTIIFEQSWGERGAKLNQFGQPVGQRFRGKASLGVATPADEYPESWSYDDDTHQLTVGEGRFDHVSPEVVHFEVSGMNVLRSWLGYRMKNPAGKSSSPLDQMQAATWQHDGELLELLWQLEFMVAAEPRGAELLDSVIAGEKIAPAVLGLPTAAEMKAPPKKQQGTMFE